MGASELAEHPGAPTQHVAWAVWEAALWAKERARVPSADADAVCSDEPRVWFLHAPHGFRELDPGRGCVAEALVPQHSQPGVAPATDLARARLQAREAAPRADVDGALSLAWRDRRGCVDVCDEGRERVGVDHGVEPHAQLPVRAVTDTEDLVRDGRFHRPTQVTEEPITEGELFDLVCVQAIRAVRVLEIELVEVQWELIDLEGLDLVRGSLPPTPRLT